MSNNSFLTPLLVLGGVLLATNLLGGKKKTVTNNAESITELPVPNRNNGDVVDNSITEAITSIQSFQPAVTENNNTATKPFKFANNTSVEITGITAPTNKAVNAKSPQALYNSWQLTSRHNQEFGKYELVLTRNGEEKVVKRSTSQVEINKLKALFKPANATQFDSQQAKNGNCFALASLQNYMVTGNNVEQLIAATGYDATKGVYTMSYDTGSGKRKVYSMSEKQLANAMDDQAVAYSSTHQPLLALVDNTLRASIVDSGETPTGEKITSRNRYDAKTFKDGGFTNFLPELLNANTTATLYVKNGDGLASAEIGERGEYIGTVDDATQKAINKPKNTLTMADIATLYKQNAQQQITLSINPANAKLITKNLQDKDITDSHAYTLLNVDTEADTITVLNPWDAKKPVTLKASEVVFDRATVTTLV